MKHLIGFALGFALFALDSVHSQGGPGFQNYCVSSTTSLGCTAMITGSPGQPVSGNNDWSVSISGAQAQRAGIFFSSDTGPANIPFQAGGSLCMFPPLRRGPIRYTGGTNGNCDGGYSQILNDGSLFPAGIDGGPGGTTYVQAWYRDIVTPLGTLTGLSDAIQVNWAP